MSLLLRGVVLALASCLAWGAAPQASKAAPPAKVKGGPAISDAELEKAVRARFARSKINADGFTVKVQNGVATLEGHTDVIQHKGTATRIAHSVGAHDVRNNIKISDAARMKARANLDKGRRKAEVKRGEARNEKRSERGG